MRVPNLIGLTRIKGRLTLSLEAIAEFDHLKECLRSPAVLRCFQPGRKTFVYTDASVGHHDTAGGLGAVITQVIDGYKYVCAYASATLSPATTIDPGRNSTPENAKTFNRPTKFRDR